MARTHAEQFLHDFRFHARATLGGTDFGSGEDVLRSEADPERSEAGFQTFTIPTYEVGTAEYRDGLRLHTLKQPGTPETNTITAERGVTKKDSAFFEWMLRYLLGEEFYANVKLIQWPHSDQPVNKQQGLGDSKDRDPEQAKQYIMHNCFPTSVVPASDLDADSEDISIQELEFEFEWFEIFEPGRSRVGL